MAELVDRLVKANVAAIGFDVLFSEKDQPGGEVKACAKSAARSADEASHCEERADGDKAFAHAIAGRPVVLGVFLTQTHNGAQASLTAKAGFSFVGDSPAPFLNQLQGAIAPIPALADASSGLGFLNWLPDNDRVVRRVPLLLAVNGQIEPSLAIETLRLAQSASSYVVKSTTRYGNTSGRSEGVEAIKVGDVVIPVQADGELRVWFAKSNPRRSIPAWKVLQPDADLTDLAGKIVLVGASASLLSDIVATPLNPSTPGVEAHAQLIEQILSGVTLERPDWAPGAEPFASAMLSLALVALLPFVPILLDRDIRRVRRRSARLPRLVRVHSARSSLRPRRCPPLVRLRIPRRRRAALWPEAPAGERDPLGLRPLCFSRRRRPPRRTPGAASARRATARADRDVLRHPVVHDPV